jgi:hypothetical protein
MEGKNKKGLPTWQVVLGLGFALLLIYFTANAEYKKSPIGDLERNGNQNVEGYNSRPSVAAKSKDRAESAKDSSSKTRLQIDVNPETRGNQTYFLGKTNLPDGTKLGIDLESPGTRKYKAQDYGIIVKNGTFESGGFSDKGELLKGNFNLSLFTVFNSHWQTASLLEQLKHYEGPLVTKSGFEFSKKVSLNIKGVAAGSNTGVRADERFGLSEAKRKAIFKEIVRAEDRSWAESPNDGKVRGQLDSKYKEAIAKTYGLSQEHIRSITIEGMEKNWPMP